MKRVSILMISLGLVLAVTSAAVALVSQEVSTPEASTHQLYWRAFPVDPWILVGSPQAVTDVTHPDVGGAFRGVAWSAQFGFGEYYATAANPDGESPPSNTINLGGPGPPDAPILLATLAVMAYLKRRRRCR